MSQVVVSPRPPSQLTLAGTVSWGRFSVAVTAFVDSGAAGNLIDEDWGRAQGIPLHRLEASLPVTALGGRPLRSGMLRLITAPLNLSFGQHQEIIQFFVTKSPHLPIILGHPWLPQHNPRFNWALGTLED